MKSKAIILLGIKHSGKSTQGKLLASHCNCPFIDIDDVITEISGKNPRALYIENGVKAFLETEEEACKKVIKDFKDKNIIIATGGGICDNPLALEELRTLGTFVFINIPEKLAADRILKKATQNEDETWTGLPAYISKENPKTEIEIRKIFHNFYEKRTEIYKQISDLIINTEDRAKQENAKYISDSLGL